MGRQQLRITEHNALRTSLGVMRSFPIKAGFIVGISGEVRGYKTDVQLVDVVISQPDGQHGLAM